MRKPSTIKNQSKKFYFKPLGETFVGFNKKIIQEEARRCPQCAVASCLPACPLGIDIPGFIRLLREGDTAAALACIKKENPFPAICGRICQAPCENACVFYAEGKPIGIRALERYAADHGSEKLDKLAIPERALHVAVIGAGPAGMSAAYYLAKGGLKVSVFEAAHEPGGVMRYAIPEFRLPQKVLDDQLAQLRNLGVEIKTDVFFGQMLMIDELFMRGFSAILLATGAGLPKFSSIKGSDLAGVYYDVEFLNRLQVTSKKDALRFGQEQKMAVANTVIIGQGHSAFDTARLCLRLGSKVTVLIPGLEEHAGVPVDVLNESRDEGVDILSVQVLEIIANEAGLLEGVKYQLLEMVEEDGGLSLKSVGDESIVIEADLVVLANGHAPNHFLKRALPQLKWDEDGSLWADEMTGMTSVEKVFACGNLVSSAGLIIDAISGGKKAAQKILAYLGKS